ncbi:hypothetical protein ACFLU5_05220 [Bacteroidota bacterium]
MRNGTKNNLFRLTAILGLFNLFITALAGLLLRYQFVYPAGWLNYYNWLHAHSHIAFLGWVYFALIALIAKDLLEKAPRGFGWIIALTQISVIGMLYTFAETGYSPSAIAFSAMHMILSIFVAIIFFKILKDNRSVSALFIRLSLIMMILSGLGPLALGPVIGMGLRDTVWYDMSIYFYLHFQYNGWFMMAIIGLVSGFLERNSSIIDRNKARQSLILLSVGICLSYPLSSLGFDPPWWVYLIGGIGAVLQLWGVGYWLKSFWYSRAVFSKHLPIVAIVLLYVAFFALALKNILQVLSSLPYIASWVYHARDIIISYMHLVLMGFVSGFLLAWFLYRSWLRQGFILISGVMVFLIGLFITNSFLLARKFFPLVDPYVYLYGLLVAALLLLLSTIIFFMNSVRGESMDRNRI